MKPAGKGRRKVSIRQGVAGNGTPSDKACRVIDPGEIGGDTWSALVRHARNSDAEAYSELCLLLEGFRPWFTRRVFADPEGAYEEFVRDLVDQIRYGFLRDPHSLLAQARARALRKTADRIRCLTAAARILSAIPKRDRDVWIRSQLALNPSGAAALPPLCAPSGEASSGPGFVSFLS